jgi:hypothetical protein
MALPEFNRMGDLPLGVHKATLVDVLARFGSGSRQRVSVGQRLERIYHISLETGQLARFVVFGSFITDEPDPNDVDVFLIMDDAFDAQSLKDEAALLFDHPEADAHFGASVFWTRRLAAFGGEQNAVEYWQVKRGGGQRGIIEIVGD